MSSIFQKTVTGSHIVRCAIGSKTERTLLDTKSCKIPISKGSSGYYDYAPATVLQVMPLTSDYLLIEYIRLDEC